MRNVIVVCRRSIDKPIGQFFTVNNWSICIERTRNVRGESPLDVVMTLFPAFLRKLEIILDCASIAVGSITEEEVDCVLGAILRTHLFLPYVELAKEFRVAPAV